MTAIADLVGFSRGMYSNWLWHRPLQLLVDVGEGVQLALGTSVFAPSWLAITHGHSDHVLGLPGLLAARRFGKGAQQKPLTIFHPHGSRGVDAVRELMRTMYAGVEFPVTWVAMAPGDTQAMGKALTIDAIEARHNPGEPALAYRVVEQRRRLRAEYQQYSRDAIEDLARRGQRDAMMETTSHIVFAHSGDAMPLEPAAVHDADLLVHDATFLDATNRREPIHASTMEALDVARQAGARALVLNHLSVRYPRTAAVETLRQQVIDSGYTGPVWLLDEGDFIPVTSGTAASGT